MKNGPEDVFDVDPSQQSTTGMSRGAKFFSSQLFAFADQLQTPLQARQCADQQIALSCPRNDRALAGAKEVCRKPDQGTDQLCDAIAPAGRDPELAGT